MSSEMFLAMYEVIDKRADKFHIPRQRVVEEGIRYLERIAEEDEQRGKR